MAEAKKADKMKTKTEDVRRAFNLPETEFVVQDYICALNSKHGRLYITQNYILFLPGLVGAELSIPFRIVKSLKKERNTLIFDNSIAIEVEDGTKHFFSSFVHRDETFNIIEYLWKNPPSYIDLDEDDTTMIIHSPQYDNDESDKYNESYGNKTSYGNSNDRFRTNNNSNANISSGRMQQEQLDVQVDTQSSRNALRIAKEARDIGTSTLVELTMQAEQIDRIEKDIETVHANVDRANRLLKGIESLPGAISNSMTSDKQSNKLQFKDRSLEIKRKDAPPVDYDILEKMPNDFLKPAIFRLTEDRFICLDAVTKKPEPNSIWPYDKIDSVVLRARHQHIDIRFKDKNRFRMCTSYVQQIVNEISLRSPVTVNIIFEPGTRKFPYGRPNLSLSENKDRSKLLPGTSFRKVGGGQKPITKTIFKDASDDIKKQIDQQDEDLDEISNVLSDITAIANTMGEEVDRQTDQLERITNRTDDANVRMHNTNKRIDRLL